MYTALIRCLITISAAMALITFVSACAPSNKSSNTQVPNTNKPKSSDPSKSLQSQLPHYLERDIRDEVFYFVLPDRFDNGDPSNDQGSKSITISSGGFDPKSTGHYHGGDIQGLINRIPYLKQMGVTAIWLTPILRNQAVQGDSAGYHGYWPLDFTEIDPHLGNNQTLKEFIDIAHQHNIKVFFDIITNHTADVIKYRECHTSDKPLFSTEKPLCEYKSLKQVASGDRYTPFIPKGNETLKSPHWLNNPDVYHNQGDSTWQGENSLYGDFVGLDDIDTDNPRVVNGMINIFSQLISEFKPDGFRIDTVKHVNVEFWQQFTPAIIQHAQEMGIPNFFVFGEVYSGDPKTLSYYTTVGDIPSVLDFAFQYKVKDLLVYNKRPEQFSNLFSQDHLYQDHNSSADTLMNFISNHDIGRFAHFLSKERPSLSDKEKLQRVILAHELMFFSRGIPVIYYGDEQGFVGDGGDRGAREDMMRSMTASYNDNDLIGTSNTTADNNFDQAHPLYQTIQKLSNVYLKHKVLRYGQQRMIKTPQGSPLLIFKRHYNHQTAFIIVNTSPQPFMFDNELKSLNAEAANNIIYGASSTQLTPDNHLEKIDGLSTVIIALEKPSN
ncbi:alpha-amylase family glycosyl hydrolase [Pleionea mediterranea]|uniref:Glycosidase n=1 Tax=Pleionea mediterranea TaxID=523701 RepID=A0A316FVZ2_9GAMM|nr:alpha-amylase family glycosyl hydrolase [Pleionea mediterranea]PWK52881.1 glycosidase [Pleionea mediterranea]